MIPAISPEVLDCENAELPTSIANSAKPKSLTRADLHSRWAGRRTGGFFAHSGRSLKDKLSENLNLSRIAGIELIEAAE